MNILVIGLRKQQLKKLTMLFPKLNISGMCAQENHRGHANGRYDHVISVTKFTNHSTEYSYNRHKGYIRISNGGGYSRVISIINDLTRGELVHG